MSISHGASPVMGTFETPRENLAATLGPFILYCITSPGDRICKNEPFLSNGTLEPTGGLGASSDQFPLILGKP